MVISIMYIIVSSDIHIYFIIPHFGEKCNRLSPKNQKNRFTMPEAAFELYWRRNNIRETLIKSNSPRSNEGTHGAEFDALRFIQRIPKDYGMSAVAFNKLLHELRIQFPIRNSWVLYAEYADKNYTQSKTYQIGEDKSVMHTCWTQAGRLFLYQFLKERGILPMCEQED